MPTQDGLLRQRRTSWWLAGAAIIYLGVLLNSLGVVLSLKLVPLWDAARVARRREL